MSAEKLKYIYAPQNKWKTDDVIRSKFICNNYEIIISLKKIDNTIHSVNVSVGSTGGNVVDVSLVSSEGSSLGGMEVLRG